MKRHIFLSLVLVFFCLPLYPQSDSFGTVKGDAVALYRTGRDLEAHGRLQEAGTYYTQVVQLCNEEISQSNANRDTYTALTWALLRQRKYNETIVWGERGLRLYADEYRIVETMGEAYFYLDDFENSLKFMQRYANNLPQGERVSVAYFFVGEIYRLGEKYHLADMAYSTAVRLQPSIALWWFRLGQVRENSAELVHAASAYQQAIRLQPNYPAASEGLARARRAAQ
jgi:tetratricopeptide (TPR) repeat protein